MEIVWTRELRRMGARLIRAKPIALDGGEVRWLLMYVEVQS
jgi:hypothetical protein